MFTIPFIW